MVAERMDVTFSECPHWRDANVIVNYPNPVGASSHTYTQTNHISGVYWKEERLLPERKEMRKGSGNEMTQNALIYLHKFAKEFC